MNLMKTILVLSSTVFMLANGECCDDVCGVGDVCMGNCVGGIVQCDCEFDCTPGTYTQCIAYACGSGGGGFCLGGDGCDCLITSEQYYGVCLSTWLGGASLSSLRFCAVA